MQHAHTCLPCCPLCVRAPHGTFCVTLISGIALLRYYCTLSWALLSPVPCITVLSCRVLFSTDQGFPLAAAFAYSVYQFQSKRVKRNPEGPFFGGNAMVGALFSTLCCLAVACGVSGSV